MSCRKQPTRLSLYGDVWMRVVTWGVRSCPGFLEPLFAFLVAAAVTLLAKNQRRTLSANLHVLLGKKTWLHDCCRVFRVFWNFAWTLIDSARVRNGELPLRWEVAGAEHFDALKAHTGGLILLTAHMGSYDIAAPIFCDVFQRKLNAVRMPEKNAALQAYMEQTRDAMQSANYTILYNSGESLLGIQLAQCLSRNEIIAVQGDRVMPGISTSKVPLPQHPGHLWALPRGPFALASAAKCPLFPVFITRKGWRSYQVEFFPKLAFEPPTNMAEKRKEPEVILTAWVNQLLPVLQKHWDQWAALEPAFEPQSSES